MTETGQSDSEIIYEGKCPPRGACLVFNIDHFEMPSATWHGELQRERREGRAFLVVLPMSSYGIWFHCGEVARA